MRMVLKLGFVAADIVAAAQEVAARDKGGGDGDHLRSLDGWGCSGEDEHSGDEA
jgi:hypothetical protein